MFKTNKTVVLKLFNRRVLFKLYHEKTSPKAFCPPHTEFFTDFYLSEEKVSSQKW